MEVPKDFFTASTLFTLGGSATAVWIITSVIGYVMDSQSSQKLKKWIGLILSLVLTLLGASLLADPDPLKWVVAVVNGFLVYLTAIGINTVVSPAAPRGGQLPIRETGAGGKSNRGRFAERWF